MFTAKFYSHDGCRQIIKEAESFTILRSPIGGDGGAEITLHQKNGDSCRIDIVEDLPRPEGWPPVFGKAIIENAAGRTTEIIALRPAKTQLATGDGGKITVEVIPSVGNPPLGLGGETPTGTAAASV